MWDWLSQPTVQTVLAVLVLLAVLYFGFLSLKWLRPSTSKDDMNPLDLAKNFEEMQLEGDIDEAELRKIKAVIGKTQSDAASD